MTSRRTTRRASSPSTPPVGYKCLHQSVNTSRSSRAAAIVTGPYLAMLSRTLLFFVDLFEDILNLSSVAFRNGQAPRFNSFLLTAWPVIGRERQPS